MAARILIVEDEPGLLEGLTHNFQFEGYEVDTAATAKDGLKSALKDKPDLVVLDLMLPEKSASTCSRSSANGTRPRPSSS